MTQPGGLTQRSGGHPGGRESAGLSFASDSNQKAKRECFSIIEPQGTDQEQHAMTSEDLRNLSSRGFLG